MNNLDEIIGGATFLLSFQRDALAKLLNEKMVTEELVRDIADTLLYRLFDKHYSDLNSEERQMIEYVIKDICPK